MLIRCENCFLKYDDSGKTCIYCGYSKGDMPEEMFYLAPGTVLCGRYIIGQVIGSGGFGIIYKAWDIADDMLVAVKEFYPSGLVARIPGTSEIKLVASSRIEWFEEGRKRFTDEAYNTAKFSGHPNIIKILFNFEENNTVYCVMEYLHGANLSKRLEDNAKMDVGESLDIIYKICHALKSVHAAGIIHRDVSPDNIIIPPDYPDNAEADVKLIDFGAARFSPSEKETLSTRIMKPGYSPPEQYEPGTNKSEQMDVYALGATLYHMLTGFLPDEATNLKIAGALVPPRSHNNDIPEHVSNAILKAMSIDLRFRFRTIDEFEKALKGEIKVIPPDEAKSALIKKVKIFIASAAAFMIVGLCILGAFTSSQIDSATLPDASIQVWYRLSGDDYIDNAKTEALTAVVDDFTGNFPNVVISLKGIPQENYLDEVVSAQKSGNSPILLESTDLPEDVLLKMSDVSDVLGGTEKQDSYFLDNYRRYFPGKRQIPLGFNAAAIFINTGLCEYEHNSAGNLAAIFAAMPPEVSEKGISYNDAAIGNPLSVFGVNYPLADSESFFEGETGVYYTDTSEFYKIWETMPARYKMLYIDNNTVPAKFTDLWSVLPCGKAERKAARRLLQYMLGGNAQDHLHIRSQSGSLPINKRAADAYKEVYNDYQWFFENVANYTFVTVAD